MPGWGLNAWGISQWSNQENTAVTVSEVIEVIENGSVVSFFATAQSARKVQLTFAVPMTVNAALTTPGNYTVKSLSGTTVPVTGVHTTGPAPFSRVYLDLGSNLLSGGFYSVTVSSAVRTYTDIPVYPSTVVFQWAEMPIPTNVRPLAISIGNFSGEVSGGVLGHPLGQVFFSPALQTAIGGSVLEVDEVSVCTKAFDEYHFPELPDPPTLRTFGVGLAPSLLNGASLWSPAERQGLARMNLGDHRADTLHHPVDSRAIATLVEPIDITRAGFLNDRRWHLFNGIARTFITADNLTPIGPGPTIVRTLEP